MSPHQEPILLIPADLQASSPLASRFRPQGICGSIVYFKRYKMEADLDELPPVDPPPAFCLLPWESRLLESHAEVLGLSFQGEIDSVVFVSLSSIEGCRGLMQEIVRRSGFLPEATWLAACETGCCGSIQGVRERPGLGAIQNLGVLPVYRGRGLGRALLLQAMHGFRSAGLTRCMLEVTAENEGAIRLYRSLGFRRVRTVYKAVAPFRKG